MSGREDKRAAGEKRITFAGAVMECFNDKDFMREYRRLAKTDFGLSRGIEYEIDVATGRFDAEARKFFDYVREFVWLPIVARRA